MPGTPAPVDAGLVLLSVWCALQALRSVVSPRTAAVVDHDGLTLGTRRLPWGAISRVEVRPALLGPRLRAETARGRWRAQVAAPWVAPRGIIRLVEEVEAVRPGTTAALPPTPAHRARAVVVPLGAVALLAATGWLLRSLLVPGAWVTGPGQPVDVRQRLRGAGADGGNVLVLTIRDQPAPPRLVVRALFDDTLELRWRSPIGVELDDPDATRDRDAAKGAALAAAFRCVGRGSAVQGGEVEVGEVAGDSRATALVEEGERIVAVDGAPVRFKEDVYAAIERRAAGERATVELDDDGRRHTERLPVVAAEGTTVLSGVEVRRRPFELGPVERGVALDLDDIEGDSAGLAVALALVDVLRATGVPPVRRLAVTGSVSPEGVVGPVGGLRYKVAGARRAAASILLVPSSQLGLVRRSAGETLPVVGVRTLHDGLRALGMPGCVEPP